MDEVIFPEKPILVVDDEENFLKSVEFILKYDGITNFVLCNDSREVLPQLNRQEFSLILLDLLMPFITGQEILPRIVEDFPEIPVIVITAENRIERAVECIKAGAADYIVKPVDENRLLLTLKNIIKFNEVQKVNKLLTNRIGTDRIEDPDAFFDIKTQNEKMKSIFQYVEAIGKTSFPVLITGETGTGKELLAKSIHRVSDRKGKFVALNIAGEDNSVVSDTLFGHAKGGFTGAVGYRKGLIEQAVSGTFFLDEIGDLNREVQVKLLRLLQEKKYYPIGSDTEKTTDARFIFATNQRIEKLLEEKKFRKDLYYRLQSHHIHLPPLKERADDIPLLIQYFLEKGSEELGKKKPTPPPELFTLLANYNFPGNVRELQGMIFDALSRHTKGILSMSTFIEKINPEQPIQKYSEDDALDEITTDKSKIIFKGNIPTLKEMEEILINRALNDSKGNQTMAARILGLSRKALNNRLIRKKKPD
jgi:DNA-binding NtrC family response regulator